MSHVKGTATVIHKTKKIKGDFPISCYLLC